MKIFSTISQADFEQFQRENMDPALALIGDGLKKQGLRAQVAARLLGFRAFEAITFDSKTTPEPPALENPDRDEYFLARNTSIYDDFSSYMRNRLLRYATPVQSIERFLSTTNYAELLDIAYHKHPDFQLPKEEDCVHGRSFKEIKDEYLAITDLAMHKACTLLSKIYTVVHFPMDAALLRSLLDDSELLFNPQSSADRLKHLEALSAIISRCVRGSNNIEKARKRAIPAIASTEESAA